MTLQSCPTWRQEGWARQWTQAAPRDKVALFHLAVRVIPGEELGH